MDARHLIIIYYKGKYVLAQYGQWDGYPSGQGVAILKFVSSPSKLAALKSNLHLLQVATKEQLEAINKEIVQAGEELKDKLENSWDVLEAEIAFAKTHYAGLSRESGAMILDFIADAKDDWMSSMNMGLSSLQFAMNYRPCEWIYVLDLDTNAIEIYTGSEPKTEARSRRFIDLWQRDGEHKDAEFAAKNDTPKIVASFDLERLPTIIPCDCEFENLDWDEDDDEEYDDGDGGEVEAGGAEVRATTGGAE